METTHATSATSLDHAHHFQMYNRFPVTLTHGQGCTVYDAEGKAYLDGLAGIAVNTLGHAHPALVGAIQEQAARLMHVSNLYFTEPQAQLAQKLTEVAGMERVFFCNSGAEANEGAIKLARKIAKQRGRGGEIISLQNAFHGRTIGTIALGQEKYSKDFVPMPGVLRQAVFNDIEAVKALVSQETAAILVEPIQGEGGIYPAQKEFLEQLRALCDEHQLTLIFDEVQTGVGRTGFWYAWQYYSVRPDILASAKGLGGGFPIGAVLAREEIAQYLKPGDHGTTYGGNPLAAAAALAVLNTVQAEGLLEATQANGRYLRRRLEEFQAKFTEDVLEVRGVGLMQGVQMAYPTRPLVTLLLQEGVLASATAGTVVRFVPPLIVTQDEIDQMVSGLERAMERYQEEK
ncbi:MAG: aspartate aminotransferase family protein [Bacteroidota bacterium]